MDLGRLRRIVDALIEEEGEVRLLQCTLQRCSGDTGLLKASGKIENDSQPRIKDVLEELQSNG